MTRRSQAIAVIALLLAAFALRYAVAGRAIWFDERFTLLNTESVGAAIDHCLKDVHPPLYFVLMALWRALLPSTELYMRLLSLIFGMASLVGILLAAREVAGRRAGVAALAIATFAPHHWLYSTELRPYAMFLAFSAFATWAFLCAMKTGKLKYFALLAVFTALNLYTHYFAVFLLLSQALVLLTVALRNSATGRWTSGYRNRLILYGLFTLAVVAVAYAPWMSVLRGIITASVVDGDVVGAGRRVGRGVTAKLISTSLFDSMGQGLIPFVLQAAFVAWAVTLRRFRDASLLFIVTWVLPFLLLSAWRPEHFIAAKYFVFAYPVTAAMAGVGLASVAGFVAEKGGRTALIFGLLVLVVALSPLLPGQHKRYAFHRSDWRDVVAALGEHAGHGERVCFPADSKSYAMVMHYADEGFFGRHPVILWRASDGPAPFVSLEPGASVWLLKRGKLPADLQTGLAAGLETVETWQIYPDAVTLYHFTSK